MEALGEVVLCVGSAAFDFAWLASFMGWEATAKVIVDWLRSAGGLATFLVLVAVRVVSSSLMT